MYRQPLTVDTAHAQQKYFAQADTVLDDTTIDQQALDSGLEMSPNMADSRRESLTLSSAVFSPKAEPWHSVDMETAPSSHPFTEAQPPMQSNNPFFRMQQAQQVQAFPAQPTNLWQMNNGAPMQHFDAVPPVFGSSSPLFPAGPMGATMPFGNSIPQVGMFQNLSSQPMSQSPSANSTIQDQKDVTSHIVRSHNEMRRGDGIRKKHTRFEIPAERNLNNIETLIAQSTDEAEIKELKHQKRLLRNRQAALDSRQRKKQHTERLEDEQKQYTNMIGDLEEQVEQMRIQMDQLIMEKEHAFNIVERLNFEKEELVSAHTNETGELRKKINVLTGHIQQLEDASPHDGGAFDSSYGEMDGFTLDSHWDNMGMFGQFPPEQSKPRVAPQVVQAPKVDAIASRDNDKAATQGGLLFMLFLVGAFVLSNRAPSIPRVSEDVRAASATLLDNVLKDAGVAQSQSMVSQATGTSWASMPSASMPAFPHSAAGLSTSVLEQLSDRLTQPTQEQANEQLFSLSAADYNSIAGADLTSSDMAKEPTPRPGRRNLADALAAMRQNSKAEVYTRSLLWDQIPTDVVRTFAKMVAETKTNTNDGSNAAT